MGMHRISTLVFLIAVLASVEAVAQGQGRQVRARPFNGLEEVPAISTAAKGTFRGTISVDGEEMEFELTYRDLEGEVAQAHIHLGRSRTNGGVAIFLCSNLEGAPAGTQACPPSPGEVSGTLSADDVIGPSGQGISAGEWEEVVGALRRGATYVNVHTDLHPSGEIRGQLRINKGNPGD